MVLHNYTTNKTSKTETQPTYRVDLNSVKVLKKGGVAYDNQSS